MARYNQTIDTTPQAIRDFAQSLRMLADTFDRQAESMGAMQIDAASVTHWKTAKSSLSGLAAFAGAIQDAIVTQHIQGTINAMPISVEQSQAIVAKAIEDKRSESKKPGPRRSKN